MKSINKHALSTLFSLLKCTIQNVYISSTEICIRLISLSLSFSLSLSLSLQAIWVCIFWNLIDWCSWFYSFVFTCIFTGSLWFPWLICFLFASFDETPKFSSNMIIVKAKRQPSSFILRFLKFKNTIFYYKLEVNFSISVFLNVCKITMLPNFCPRFALCFYY